MEKQNLINILETSRCNTVKRAAAILREDVESLKSDDRTLALFFNHLLSAANSHHAASSTTERYVTSFSQDVMHAVLHEDFVTLACNNGAWITQPHWTEIITSSCFKTWPFYQLRSNLPNRNCSS